MGQHFVPREFLRHFACLGEPDLIWAYDKKRRSFKKLPVKNVAQAPDFYSAQDERMLSHDVEGPAQEPLNRLRRGEHLTPEQRGAVSLYLASLVFRSPRTKRRRLGILQKDPIGVVLAGAQSMGWDPAERELDRLTEIYATEPIDMRHSAVRSQRIPMEIAACIASMRWRAIRMATSRLVVADHPVYFNERQGVGSPEGEIAVPLAHDVAFIANWSGAPGTVEFTEESSTTRPVFERIAKDLNRRMVFQADRFIYGRELYPWLPKMAENPMWNRMRVAGPPVG